MKKVIIIGGGIAGLGAALKVKRAAAAGEDVDFVLARARRSSRRQDRRRDHRRTSTAPGSSTADPTRFLTAKPAVKRIAAEVGIAGDTMPTDESRKKTLILSRGKLYEMPDGVMMFAPTKFVPFATTGLFSWPGKLRAGMDLFVPKKKVEPGEFNDETLESFITRRMGREILDRLAEPLVGGVHGSDPADMSLAATFPNLLEMEQKHGNMITAFLAQRKMVEEMRKKYPPDPKNPKTFFTAFTKGMHELPEAMADTAGRDKIRTGAAVTALERQDDGTWAVTLDDGSVVAGDAVVVATESWAAEPLLRPVDAEIADALAGIGASSSATVSIAFNEDEIGININAFGVLCPAQEKAKLLAATFSSTKWPGRAPKGKVLMRGVRGRTAEPEDHGEERRGDHRDRRSRTAQDLGDQPRRQAALPQVLPLDSGHAAVLDGSPRPRRDDRGAVRGDSGPWRWRRQLPRRRAAQLHRERRGGREQGSRRLWDRRLPRTPPSRSARTSARSPRRR